MKHILNIQRMAWLAPLAALGLAASPATADTPPQAREQQASIPFVNHGGIRDWRSEGDSTLYLQDRHRQWYKAELMGPAFELPYAWAIGFDVGPIDRLDHFSSVVVEGQRYPLQSLVRVEGPPAHEARDG